MPCGTFVLNENSSRPVVLVPMLKIFFSLSLTMPQKAAVFVSVEFLGLSNDCN
jgi:hypothetical protein